MKRVICLVILGFFVLSLSNFSWAEMGMSKDKMYLAQVKTSEETTTMEKTEKVEEKAVDIGNKICPVSGEQVDEKMKATYEYEGKIYNFCCAMCIDEFKKAPEKYIQKVEDELKTQVKEEAKMETKEETKTTTEPVMEEGMHKGSHH